MTLTFQLTSNNSIESSFKKCHVLRIIQENETSCASVPYGFKHSSLYPASLSRAIKNLRLWGVFCASTNSVVFHSINRSDCSRFIKGVPSLSSAGLYLIRFDSAY